MFRVSKTGTFKGSVAVSTGVIGPEALGFPKLVVPFWESASPHEEDFNTWGGLY